VCFYQIEEDHRRPDAIAIFRHGSKSQGGIRPFDAGRHRGGEQIDVNDTGTLASDAGWVTLKVRRGRWAIEPTQRNPRLEEDPLRLHLGVFQSPCGGRIAVHADGDGRLVELAL
jgi:hypothetical protein